MTNKLYVFGSSHTDSKEKAELKPLLHRVGETGGVILAEFENDAYTTSALKRFKELDEKEVLTVIEHEFGGKSIAPYNFLKMAQQHEGISKILSTEPKFEGKIKILSKAIKPVYEEFESSFERAKSHSNRTGTLDKLINIYAALEAVSARQYMFREAHMSRFVADRVKRNTGDTLLYTHYIHAAAIKEYLRKKHIRYEEREDSYIHELERRGWRMLHTALDNTGSGFTHSQKLMFARGILEHKILFSDNINMSLKQEHQLYRRINHSIRTLDDFKDAMAGFEAFKNTVRKAVM